MTTPARLSNVDDRLRNVETQLARAVTLLENQNELLERLDHEMYGNGHEGLKTRVAALERTEKRWARNVQAVWAAVLTLLGKAVWDLLQKP